MASWRRKTLSVIALIGLVVVLLASPAAANSAPTVAVSSPVQGQEFDVPLVTVSGNASDDVGVASVELAIRDRSAGLWLQADDTWAAGYAKRPAVLDVPGGAAVDWSLSIDLPTGSYGVSVTATDSAGTVAAPKPWVVFSVDLTDSAPVAAITAPSNGAVLVAGAVSVTGTATDDAAVQSVEVAIQDIDTGLWAQIDGSFGPTRATANAVLSAPGTPVTDWSLTWTTPSTGNFRIEATAVDSAGQASLLATVNVAVGSITLSGSIDTAGNDFVVHHVDIPAAGRIVVDLDWDDPNADLSLFFKTGSGTNVAEVFTTLKPESLTYVVPTAGAYRLAVKAKTGATDYDATVKFVPAVGADLAFSDTINTGETKSFPIIVGPGVGEAGRLSAAISWDGGLYPTANLNAEIRDDNGTRLARANFSDSNPEVLTVLATQPGTYTVVVSAPSAASVPFDLVVERPGNAIPTVSVDTPLPSETLYVSPVTISGTAADDDTIDHVEVIVNDAIAATTDTYSVTVDEFGAWSVDVAFDADADITVEARSFDSVGQFSVVAVTDFVVDIDAAPSVTIALPTAGAISQVGMVAVTGQGADDATVTAVEVAVQDSATGLWSQFDGTFGATRTVLGATLSGDSHSPEFSAAIVVDEGSYLVEVEALDDGGNRSDTQSVTFTASAVAEPGTIAQSTWSANGPVFAVASDSEHMYVGGSFSQVGQSIGSGAIVDGITGLRTSDDQVGFDGPVAGAVKDGAGGWFVYGDFDYVGGKYRRGAAQISAAGTVTNWAPRPNGEVTAATYDSVTGTVYLSGPFSALRGSPTTKLVAVDDVDGLMKPAFVSNVNRPASALELSADGSVLYVGGAFELINGQSRLNLGAVSTVDGANTSIVANTNGEVRALALDADTDHLYVGGDFTTLGGTSRSHLAQIDSTGAVAAWTADTDGPVNDLDIDSAADQLLVAGSFTTLAGQARANLGAVDLTTAALAPWAPTADGEINSVRIDGATVYLAGAFTTVEGLARQGLGSVDLASGLVSAWDPRSSSTASIALATPSGVFVGGEFVFINGVNRSNLAAIKVSDGEVNLNWQADTDGAVRAVDRSPDDGRLYVGGDFINLNGVTVDRVAAVAANDGTLDTSFAVTAADTVLAIEAQGAYVYLGGRFVQTNNIYRGRLTRVATSNGALDVNFQPRPSGRIEDIHLTADGSLVYAVGKFDTIDGAARNSIAAVDTTTFAVTAWNPAAYTNDQLAYSVDLNADESMVFVASGGFKNNGGNRVHAIAAGTGTVVWDVRGDGDAQAVVAIGDRVWVGSHWQVISDTGQPCLRLCVLDGDTGALDTSWTVSSNSQLGVWDLDVGVYGLAVGGEFTKINNEPRASIGHFGY